MTAPQSLEQLFNRQSFTTYIGKNSNKDGYKFILEYAGITDHKLIEMLQYDPDTIAAYRQFLRNETPSTSRVPDIFSTSQPSVSHSETTAAVMLTSK